MKRLGFTLLELIIAIVISGVLITAITLSWPGRSINLNAISHSVISDLSYLRMLAYTKERNYRVDFDTTATSYGFTSQDGISSIINPTTNTDRISFPNEVTVSLVGFGAENDMIFNRHGEPLVGGTFEPLDSNAFIRIRYEGKTATIIIAAHTGAIFGPIVTGG